MSEVLRGHEFDALKLRFENQTEQLYRMTLIDLQVFTGYITLQLGLGAWLSTHQVRTAHWWAIVGLMISDLVLASIAIILLRNSFMRRKEVAAIVRNCSDALGYSTAGVYLPDRALDVKMTFRPWAPAYLVGVVAAAVGVWITLLAAVL